MGSWDCYCAICGGPFVGVRVSEKSRIRRQAARRAQQHRSGQEETPHTESAGDSGTDYHGEDDEESIESDDDEYNDYDPAIISEDETAWTRTLHILGFNVYAPGVSKGFVSGPGTYSDYGGVDVEPGNDPNLIEDGFFSCYYDFDNGDNPVFPFHLCCYELLATALTGTSDVTKIDKDLLFSVMHELSPDYTSRLDLDYGDPGPEAEQFWDSTPGMEFVVAHPIVPDLTNIIKATVASCDFIIPSSEHDLGSRIKHDPFLKLPYDLIHSIVCLLPIKSLLDLEKASWPVHSVLRENPSFWQESIKRTMPWFFEVQELMKESENIQRKDLKGLLLWADAISTPRTKMTGPFMGLANRRRIWDVCEQLAALYLPRWHQKDGPRLGFIENMIRTQSACVHLPVVSSPVPVKKDQALTYWVRAWEDVYARPNVFEAFWNAEGSLIGLSVMPDGERRLFGNDDTNQGVSKQVVEIEKGDWITGFILHIPEICLHKGTSKNAPAKGSHLWTSTSIKGITILYKSGPRAHLGATESKYSKRPLFASKNMYLVGIMGQIGPNQEIIRLGLLQAKHPEFEDYSIVEGNISIDAPPPPPLEKYLWRNDNSSILQTQIWAHPTLRLVAIEGTLDKLQSDVHDDMIPYEALIWAKDELELRRVARLSGYVVVGGTVSGWENGDSYSRDIDDLCGIRAEFTSEYGEPRRLIGRRKEDSGEDWLEEHCVHFDIDGLGGEYVNEISFIKHEAPKAVKLRTNWGREVYWGEKRTSDWQILRAPEGETIVGIVMTFGIGSRWSHETRTYAHTKLSSVAALTLPLGV